MYKSVLFKIIFVLISMSLEPVFLKAYALQVKPIKDNQMVLIKVSSKEQSRLFVKGDRILIVRGLEGAYDLKKDEDRGDIYLQPSPFYQHKAFNLFITTEQGHSYSLLATPLDIPAETIELQSSTPAHLLAERWEKNSFYSQSLINLINAMVNGSHPDGYDIITLSKNKPKKLPTCITMQLRTLYRGDHLQGEIWIIKNTSKNSILISPRDFYQENVLSAAVQEETLNTNDATILYRVVNNEQ